MKESGALLLKRTAPVSSERSNESAPAVTRQSEAPRERQGSASASDSNSGSARGVPRVASGPRRLCELILSMLLLVLMLVLVLLNQLLQVAE